MDPEKNRATPFEGFPALDRDLPEALVERQQDTGLRLSEIQQCEVARAGSIRARPSHVVTGLPQRRNSR